MKYVSSDNPPPWGESTGISPQDFLVLLFQMMSIQIDFPGQLTWRCTNRVLAGYRHLLGDLLELFFLGVIN